MSGEMVEGAYCPSGGGHRERHTVRAGDRLFPAAGAGGQNGLYILGRALSDQIDGSRRRAGSLRQASRAANDFNPVIHVENAGGERGFLILHGDAVDHQVLEREHARVEAIAFAPPSGDEQAGRRAVIVAMTAEAMVGVRDAMPDNLVRIPHGWWKPEMRQGLDSLSGDIRSQLRDKNVRHNGITREGSGILVAFRDAETRTKARGIIEQQIPDLLLTDQGAGTDLKLQATLKPEAQKRTQEFAVKQNIQTLHNRINELGVAEPVIQQQGADRVVVQLPGVQDTAKAKEILGRTATLEIRMVDEENASASALAAAAQGQIPFGDEYYVERNGQPLLVKKQVVLTGDRLTDAQPGFDQQTQEPAVHLNLDATGSRIFRDIFSTPAMRRVFSDEQRTQYYLDIELALARVQARMGIIPQEACDEILKHVTVDQYDIEKLKTETERIGYPALIKAAGGGGGPGHGRNRPGPGEGGHALADRARVPGLCRLCADRHQFRQRLLRLRYS